MNEMILGIQGISLVTHKLYYLKENRDLKQLLCDTVNKKEKCLMHRMCLFTCHYKYT